MLSIFILVCSLSSNYGLFGIWAFFSRDLFTVWKGVFKWASTSDNALLLCPASIIFFLLFFEQGIQMTWRLQVLLCWRTRVSFTASSFSYSRLLWSRNICRHQMIEMLYQTVVLELPAHVVHSQISKSVMALQNKHISNTFFCLYFEQLKILKITLKSHYCCFGGG